MTSICFAISANVLNLYGLAGDDVNKDYIWRTSEVTQYHCGLFAGYLLADTVIRTLIYPGVLYDNFFLLHHFITITAAVAVALSNAGTFVYFTRSLSEMSNVPMHLMWTLKFISGKSSRVYIANGVVFSVLFTMCRVMILPSYYHNVILALLNTPMLPPMYVLAFIPLGAVFDILNLYWFYLIVKGLIKVLRPSESQESH